MDAETYNRISEPFRRSEAGRRAVALANRIPTAIFYAAYPILIALLAFTRDPLIAPCLVVPGTTFLLVSLFRKQINAPRPYEALDIDPLVPKDTQGESFPSRHVFSATLIAGCWFALLPPVGAILYALAAILGAARVIGGVHFPKDVIAGAAIGVACGLAVAVFA